MIAIASVFKNQSINPRDNIFISGILPRDESFSVNITNEVTDLLKFRIEKTQFSAEKFQKKTKNKKQKINIVSKELRFIVVSEVTWSY